jgi:hypothetical protein
VGHLEREKYQYGSRVRVDEQAYDDWCRELNKAKHDRELAETDANKMREGWTRAHEHAKSLQMKLDSYAA